MDVDLVGTLEQIIFSQPESGFMIAVFQPEKQNDRITIKGTIFNVSENDTLMIRGDWVNHPKYGRQVMVKEFMPVLPSSLLGIERYLSSGLFKHIGDKTAQAIVEEFGLDTFAVIDETPEKLLKVEKVNQKKLDSLLKTWETYKGERDVRSFLNELGITMALANRILREVGLSAQSIIQTNPYELTRIEGIGFQTADNIARKIGFDMNSVERACAAVLYTLDQSVHNGHTCLPADFLQEQTVKQLGIDEELVRKGRQLLLEDKLLKARLIDLGGTEMEFVCRNRQYYQEKYIAENLHRILTGHAEHQFDDPGKKIRKVERKLEIELDEQQRKAVTMALTEKVLIITGGPGTGKTTIVRFILAMMRGFISEIALCAPTGRAAKRLEETTGHHALTLHRLLEYNMEGFNRNHNNPLDSDLIIVDECSMIDTSLMHAMLRAVQSEARLVLVGDADQLPSVGPGNVLLNLIESQQIPVVKLETIFRQSQGSEIVINAHKVRRGQLPNLKRVTDPESTDFFFVNEIDPDRMVDKIVTMVRDRIPQRFNFNPKTDIQVLTPMHRGPVGSVRLNTSLQAALNPNREGVKRKDFIYSVGDKVMQQVNNYDHDVFNGDIGIVVSCSPKTNELEVKFDHHQVQYTEKELDQLTLAYAISIHKSQGSEYPAVVVVASTQHYIMLQRNLLYTAITRGKRLVVVVGMEKAVQLAVENSSPTLRYTGLLHELNLVKALNEKFA